MPFSRLCLNSHKILKILLLHRGPADKPPPHPKGALAQLVEHLHGMQGVSGSNPLRSTTLIFKELQIERARKSQNGTLSVP
jgi:hypothetical protein